MTNPKTLPRQALFAALLLGFTPFAIAQTAQTTEVGPLVVEDVICAGNEHISCEFIRDHLYLKAGEPLDEEEIRNAELRLSSLRNFDSVKFRLEKGAQRGAVIVVIEVEEASPITTEWLLGASSRIDMRSGVLAGRIAHQNLFGKGKFADLSVVTSIPVANQAEAQRESYEVSLRYADPQLFDSSHYFAVASAAWRKLDIHDIHGNFGHLDTPQFDLSVGRRFADFSYVTATVSFRPGGEWIYGNWNSEGVFEVKQPEDFERTMNLTYGWSSEDDLHFPTQGSTFEVAYGGDFGSGSPSGLSHLQFRKTWSLAGAYWTIKFGGDPSPEFRGAFNESQMLAVTFARPITPGNDIQRGRWYIEPGFGFSGFTAAGDAIQDYGIKAGFRADTRTFGLIDLYVIGSVESRK